MHSCRDEFQTSGCSSPTRGSWTRTGSELSSRFPVWPRSHCCWRTRVCAAAWRRGPEAARQKVGRGTPAGSRSCRRAFRPGAPPAEERPVRHFLKIGVQVTEDRSYTAALLYSS